MYLPIIQYDMAINSRGVTKKMGIYNIENKAGVRPVHYMYFRCPDWATVGTTQSEIALSFIWKNTRQLPFYNLCYSRPPWEEKNPRDRLSDAFLGRVQL